MTPEKEVAEAYAMVETIAAAGARLTALAGGGDVPCGGVQFASRDGMFSEEIAHQRIRWLLRCEKAMRSMAGQICSPATTAEDMVADILGDGDGPKTKRKDKASR